MEFKFEILLILINLAISFCKRYDNYALFSITPQTKDQLKFLSSLDTSKTKNIDIVFWKRPQKVYVNCQFLVGPQDKRLFLERAQHYGFVITEQYPDIQREFDKQLILNYLRTNTDSFTWDHYSKLEDIYQWLYDIAKKYPGKVSVKTIGKSVEYRDILAVSFVNKEAEANVVIDSGIHGNEWVAVAFVTYLIDQLLHATGELKKLRQKYEWHLVPIVNPDGYMYTFTSDRLWKKNKRQHDNKTMGVDLNRNFDYNFGKFSSSSDPNHENYCGSSPFSEPETKCLADFITYVRGKKRKLKHYVSFHAYGQKIIIPYSDRINHIENFSRLENYGKQAIVRIFNTNGTRYNVGTTYDTMGKRVSGSSANWVKKKLRVPYVFTILLRDNGEYGYALPADQILPTCKETMGGLIQLMTSRPRHMRSNLFSHSNVVKLNLSVVIFCIIYILKYIFI